MLRLRQIWAIARVTLQENLRKQLLQVVLLLTCGAIAATTLLSFFDLGVQIKILKDLSLAAILFAGGVLAITVTVASIPAEVQAHTIYSYLARPLRRPDYLLAKYLGALLTCLVCLSILAVVFLGILASYEHRLDTAVLTGMGYVFLQVALLAAVGTFFSVFLAPMVSATLTIFVFLLGQIKVSYLHHLIENSPGAISQGVLTVFYFLLPNLDCFSFKDALVHGNPVPGDYMAWVAVYGVAYTAFLLSISGLIFSRKEV